MSSLWEISTLAISYSQQKKTPQNPNGSHTFYAGQQKKTLSHAKS